MEESYVVCFVDFVQKVNIGINVVMETTLLGEKFGVANDRTEISPFIQTTTWIR